MSNSVSSLGPEPKDNNLHAAGVLVGFPVNSGLEHLICIIASLSLELLCVNGPQQITALEL